MQWSLIEYRWNTLAQKTGAAHTLYSGQWFSMTNKVQYNELIVSLTGLKWLIKALVLGHWPHQSEEVIWLSVLYTCSSSLIGLTHAKGNISVPVAPHPYKVMQGGNISVPVAPHPHKVMQGGNKSVPVTPHPCKIV